MMGSLRYFLFFLGFCLPQVLLATHNRAGEIHVLQIGECGDLTIRATVITYTKASAVAADRDSLEIEWGDGTKQWIYRVNGPNSPSGFPNGEVLGNDVKRNLYVADHVYPARATYRLSVLDPNRVDNILNVNFPNSVNITFYIETIYTFLNPQFQGCNSTPFLLQDPIDFACVGRRFIHNPNAYDIDGDSISYHLIQPLQDAGSPVPKYLFPDQIGTGGMNTFTLNEVTGDLVWENPLVAGEYNVAMIIVSYRNGVPLDTTIRDMQILVEICNNAPPVITADDELCVLAGETLSRSIIANDPDVGQLVRLSATGGPFESPFSDVELIASTAFEPPPLTGTLFWPVACEEIRKQPWTIVFKAEDNDPFVPLADLHSLRIKVVGPPPLDLQAQALKDQITLNWEAPYTCEDAADNYFRGFSVWRKIGSNPFPVDECEPGLDGKGYTRIAFNQTTLESGRYVYTDTDVEPGKTYCYRILADFAFLSAAGNPFNQVPSLPSEEVCVQLQRDVPLFTKVSVQSTDVSAGQMEIVWTKPRIPDLDTILFPGPYRYRLLRSEGFLPVNPVPVPGADFTAPSYSEANDTFFIYDEGLNTVDSPYTYSLEFYVEGDMLLGVATPSSSVYLTVAASDEQNLLSWACEVPWLNYNFLVERLNTVTGLWEEIGQTSESTFLDEGLVNGVTYCYRIQALGDYGLEGIEAPLINFSQEACGVPLDTVPPCPPTLRIANICDSLDEGVPIPEVLLNTLTWIDPENICPGRSDIAGYRVFYRAPDLGDFQIIATIDQQSDTTFFHSWVLGLAGCYYIVAFDSLGNSSPPGNIVCADNCPDYRLPNTFTPNGDGDNDLFIPYPYRFIERVDFKVFNRWGNLVFETDNPDLLWNGQSADGKDVAEGVYFYTCTVYERRVEGVVPSATELSGFIQLIRGL